MWRNLYILGIAGVCSVLLLFFVAGCGASNVTGASSADSGGTPTRDMTPAVTSTPSPRPAATTSVNGTHSGDQITISLDKSQYTSGEAILVSVHNGLATSILVPDHQTNCMTVSLQLQAATGVWVTVNPCKLMTVTRLHVIAASVTSVVRLVPPGSTSGVGQWTPGTYRVAVSYGSGTAAAGPKTAVYSATFTIS